MLLGIAVIIVVWGLWIVGWDILYVPVIMLIGSVIGYVTSIILEKFSKDKSDDVN
jgi:hypothetical protein